MLLLLRVMIFENGIVIIKLYGDLTVIVISYILKVLSFNCSCN